MNYLTLFSFSFALLLAGVVIDRIWVYYRTKSSRSTADNMFIPDPLPDLSEGEARALNIYMEEWKVVIETQMHFNDLILRFRSVTLTVFVTLVAAAATVLKSVPALNISPYVLYGVPLVFWLTTFVVDLLYYHRLLLGSVAHAAKFDKSEMMKRYALFGMTACIKRHVHPPKSKVLVFVYYAFPLLAILLLVSFFH